MRPLSLPRVLKRILPSSVSCVMVTMSVLPEKPRYRPTLYSRFKKHSPSFLSIFLMVSVLGNPSSNLPEYVLGASQPLHSTAITGVALINSATVQNRETCFTVFPFGAVSAKIIPHIHINTTMDTNDIVDFGSRDGISDGLTDLLRTGVQQLIATEVEVELESFLAQYAASLTAAGHAAMVRNGHHPAWPVQTGIGPVNVCIPKVRSETGKPVTFRSTLVPPFIRKPDRWRRRCPGSI